MNATVHDDLKSMRAIAEQGASMPLLGGRYLTTWGSLSTIGLLVMFAVASGTVAAPAWVPLAVWGGIVAFGVLMTIAYARSDKAKPGSKTAANQAERIVWSMAGVAIFVYFAGLIVRQIMGLETPYVLMGSISVVVFLVYAIAFTLSAGISSQKWLNIPAFGSFVAAAVSILLMDSVWLILFTSVCVGLLTIPTGLALMAQERKVGGANA
jgi:hypothetical protein